ncbi:MAG: metallophosphoesterase, partial [Patescibacteria group bacterium]|nr:metallophosphoesterase [Patescibacteria group bacterium]
QFVASKGVFYAFGNHDLILSENRVRALLANSNIQILGNEIVKVDGLQIVGLNCYYEGRLDVKGKILSRLGYKPDKPSILLYHEPKDLKAAQEAGIDLQLSGHTHGGQMFPFNLVAKMLYRGFSGGFYRFKNFSLSVSHGAGTWGPPLRLGSRSEISLIKLLKA